MKKAIVKNISGTVTNTSAVLDAAGVAAWIAAQEADNAFGKPQHQMPKPGAKPDINGKIESVTVPATYTIDIIDLTEDLNWQDEQVEALRKSEYPTPEELLKAIWERVVNNDPAPVAALKARITAVDLKYPKKMRPK